MQSQENIGMLAQERQTRLLEILAQSQRLIAKDVSKSLRVSEDTIRRDLRALARMGKLKRVHGGAVPLSPATADFDGRLPIATAAKQRIGATAANLVEPGQTVFIDGGTTASQLARHLSHDIDLCVVTHSPSIAMELLNHQRITVEIVGGRLFRHSVVATGARTLDALERYRPDQCFIGVTGIHAGEGLTTGDGEEAEIKRAIIGRSGETAILASPEKIGAVSSFTIAPCSAAARVIVDKETPPKPLDEISNAGCEIVVSNPTS